FVTGVLVLIWPDPTVGQLWIMAGINWVVFIASIMFFGIVLAPKHDPRSAGNIQRREVTLAGTSEAQGGS
ncbi:MAG: hypothetical protein ACOC8X_13055, partial [Chloroflexota bacterium]